MKRLLFIGGLFLIFSTSCGENTPSGGGEEVTLPRLAISSVTLTEGDESRDFNFQVNLSAESDKVVTFNYTTKDGTAGVDIDYKATSGSISLQPGERTATISVEIVTDIYKELDEEFSVEISDATNATISTAIGIGTIRNDDDEVMISEGGYTTPTSYPGYTEAWAEEFDGTEINSSWWTHEIGNSGWGNNELQYYTDDAKNSFLSGGNLVIEAIKENVNGAPYTSARMITKDKKLFTHGRIDVRAILPEGQGIWPAIWMLGNNISEVGWPACGEIDIMELVGHEPGTTHGTAHWGPQGQSYSTFVGDDFKLSSGAKYSDEYHVFSIIWEPGKIDWYVDDNKFHTIRQSDVNVTYPFDREFFFILNIAVGGNWPGNPDASTQFPQRMTIDYIRVFDKI